MTDTAGHSGKAGAPASRAGSELLSDVLWLSAVVVSLFLFAANLFLGDLNQDEGWYLYGARLVSEGKLPYIDFATTQGPVMPFVYAMVNPLVDFLGVAGGRAFTGFLGFAGIACGAWLARSVASADGKKVAALVAFSLAGVNVYQSYFTTIVKTYSLAALFIIAGFLLLTCAKGRWARAAALAAGAMVALAAGTRLSAVAVFPAVIGCMAWRDLKGWRGGRAPGFLWLWFGFGGGVTLAAIFLPFYMAAPEAVRFALIDYHAARDAGGLVKSIAYKAGFVSRVVQAYFVAVSVGVTLLVWMVARRQAGGAVGAAAPGREHRHGEVPVVAAIWWSVAAVSAVHLLSPFPYDDYQAMVFPLFAAGLGVAVAGLAGDEKTRWRIAVIVLLACTASAFSSSINQKWFVSERDRIWWPVKKQTPLMVLQEAACRVKALAGPGGLILTQDPYLAVEAGCRIPKGMELGPFCYFPDWSDAKAEKCRVLNRDMLLRTIETCGAQVAAFSGYGLVIQCPSVTRIPGQEQEKLWQSVEKKYKLHQEMADFGQAYTTLKILKLR